MIRTRLRSLSTSARGLDLLSVAAASAYSLRRLRAAYAGQAIRVRRSSDNAEQDIGFTADGGLDTAAMLTFIGANSAFVTTWYDQSGNTRDATQTTAADQPRIVNAGVVDTANGRPSIIFGVGAANLHLLATDPITNGAGVAYSVSAVTAPTVAMASQAGFTTLVGGVGVRLHARLSPSTNWGSFFVTEQPSGATLATSVASILTMLCTSNNTASGATFRTNGGTVTVGATSGTAQASLVIGTVITPTGRQYQGGISELILFNSALGAGDVAALEGGQGAFYAVSLA